MSKLDKAEKLYLRGFNSQYIKRRTGISIQSLLKQLLAKGVRYTKEDIINYQVDYIRQRYSDDEIIAAYKHVSDSFDDVYKAGKAHKITVLGCGFGNHAVVFRKLLGDEVYNKLKSECWKAKQVKTMTDKYGVKNVFCKETYDKFISKDAVAQGRLKRTQTLIERYGVEHPNQNKDICEKMKSSITATNREKYGVANVMQVSEIAQKSAERRQHVMLEKYGVKNSVESTEIRNHIFESRRNNKTLNISRPEIALCNMLVEVFGEDDVISNCIIDDRYPYHVDFYIKSRDLFIELNGDRCHNNHWFDETDIRDVQTVTSWTENMQQVESKTKKKSRYRKYIETWTVKDVAKRRSAKENQLNYIVFWDGSNKNGVPNLKDATAWFEDGCPDSFDWKPENTY